MHNSKVRGIDMIPRVASGIDNGVNHEDCKPKILAYPKIIVRYNIFWLNDLVHRKKLIRTQDDMSLDGKVNTQRVSSMLQYPRRNLTPKMLSGCRST